MSKSVLAVYTFVGIALCGTASAQWLTIPDPAMPRLPDGKPNLSAPAPKTGDGKPELMFRDHVQPQSLCGQSGRSNA